MDPELGRFISMDPRLGSLSIPQMQNRYVYCINNPLRFVDPTGEWSFSEWWDNNWKTVLVVAVCLAATVLLPGAGGFIAGIAVSAAVQGTVEFGATLAETRDLGASLRAAGIGALEGAISGAIGGGVGKVATAGLKSLASSSLRSVIGEASARVGASARSIGKVLPGLGSGIEKRGIAAGFRALDDVAQTGMSSDVARMGNYLMMQGVDELAVERMFATGQYGTYGMTTLLKHGLMTPVTKAAYGWRTAYGVTESLVTIGIPSFTG